MPRPHGEGAADGPDPEPLLLPPPHRQPSPVATPPPMTAWMIVFKAEEDERREKALLGSHSPAASIPPRSPAVPAACNILTAPLSTHGPKKQHRSRECTEHSDPRAVISGGGGGVMKR